MLGEMQSTTDFNAIIANQRGRFWRWIRAFAPFAVMCDHFRTWANACPHEDHQGKLQQGQKVECTALNRRLHEAPERIDAFASELRAFQQGLTLAKCEKDETILVDLTFVAQRMLPEFLLKFGWASKLPFIFSKADDPAWAEQMLFQWKDVGRENHHRVTVMLMDKFGAEVEKVAKHEVADLSKDLQRKC